MTNREEHGTFWQRFKAAMNQALHYIQELLFGEATPLAEEEFYVSARIVAGAAGALAAVTVWATLLLSASFSLGAIGLTYASLVGLVYLAYRRITVPGPLTRAAV
jgi:uncharacterized membrane protein YebE (DUF533 family)